MGTKSWPHEESKGSPIRRQTLGRHPAAQRFFYPRPVFLLPAHDGLLVPLQGTSIRFLRAPVQTMHQASHVIAVVLDSELAPDQFRNAGGGPEIRSIAVHHRPLQKKVDQAPSMPQIQLQRSSWGGAYAQCLGSAPPSSIAPAHHRTWIAANAPSHFVERATGIQQRQGSPAPIFE